MQPLQGGLQRSSSLSECMSSHTCRRTLCLLDCRGGGAARAEQNAAITQLYNKTAEVKVRGIWLLHWRATLHGASNSVAAFKDSCQLLISVVYLSFLLPPPAQAKAVQDYVSLLLESGQKFLVFGHHTCMLDAIEHACNRFKSGKKGIKWVQRVAEMACGLEGREVDSAEGTSCGCSALVAQYGGLGRPVTSNKAGSQGCALQVR